MAMPSHELDEPGSPLSRPIGWLIAFNRTVCGLLVVAMALLVSAEVICRSVFSFSLLLTEEVTSYLLVAVAFLGMGVALGERMLFRVEFLYEALPRRAQLVVQLVFDLLSLGFAAILTWQLVRLTISTFERDIVAPTILQTPLYLPQATMAFGMATAVCILVHHVWTGVLAIVPAFGGKESGR